MVNLILDCTAKFRILGLPRDARNLKDGKSVGRKELYGTPSCSNPKCEEKRAIPPQHPQGIEQETGQPRRRKYFNLLGFIWSQGWALANK
jgi:hypothetical protein